MPIIAKCCEQLTGDRHLFITLASSRALYAMHKCVMLMQHIAWVGHYSPTHRILAHSAAAGTWFSYQLIPISCHLSLKIISLSDEFGCNLQSVSGNIDHLDSGGWI